MFYAISDTHFGHANLVERSFRPFGFEHRIFKNLEKMKNGDVLIHDGDVSFHNNTYWHSEFNSILKKRFIKSWLVKGNHDKNTDRWYIDQGWDFVCDELKLKRFGINILFTHMPVELTPDFDRKDFDLNIHGHIHTRPYQHLPSRHNICLEKNGYTFESVETIVKMYKKRIKINRD